MKNCALLNLLVIRSADIDHAVRFYQAIGLTFIKHAHGNGPEHYASEQGQFVFEIYPHSKDQTTEYVRIGFAVRMLDEVIEKLRRIGVSVLKAPEPTEWGRRAIVSDFDGHRVELSEKSN